VDRDRHRKEGGKGEGHRMKTEGEGGVKWKNGKYKNGPLTSFFTSFSIYRRGRDEKNNVRRGGRHSCRDKKKRAHKDRHKCQNKGVEEANVSGSRVILFQSNREKWIRR